MDGTAPVNPSPSSASLKFRRGWNKVRTYFSNPSNSILIFFCIFLLLLNIVPIFSVFKDSFTVHTMEYVPVDPSDPFSDGLSSGTFTTYHWYEVFAGPTSRGFFWKPLGRSLIVSVLACLFALLFGGLTAFLICRSDMPLKRFISAIFIFPYIMPQWTLAIFWKNLFISTNCASGYVGEWQAIFHQAAPEWFVFGPFSISLVLGLHYAPFAYILLGGVLRNMDSNLEEAATILNIPKWKTFFKVTIPMLKPAVLSTILLVFSAAMSSYPVAVTLGNPVNYTVLAVQMKKMIEGTSGSMVGQGAICSIVLILFGIFILALNQLSTGSRKQYTTVSGKSGQTEPNHLGKVNRWIIAVLMVILVVFFCIGPMISFAFESCVPNPGDYSSGLTLKYWTSSEVLRNDYHGLFHEPKLWLALKNSFLLALCCSLLAGTFGLLIGYAVSKKRGNKFAQFVNGLAFFPYLLPSVSLSAIYFFMSQRISFLHASPFLVCILLGVMKYIPFASRSSLNAMLQLSNEIEEAGIIQNVHWGKRMTRIVFPIQKSAFLSGYLLPFISCMRELNLFVFIGDDDFILTKFLFKLEDTGISALENGANLILVIVILLVNWLVNLATGASIDKGMGGGKTKNA